MFLSDPYFDKRAVSPLAQLITAVPFLLCVISLTCYSCSGDGTIRKDPHILEAWKPQQGQALHLLQVQILLRALSLLKPTKHNSDENDEKQTTTTNLLCYSTCSNNPMENEAVVVEALRQFYQQQSKSSKEQQATKAAEIIPFPEMPGFKRRPGISSWKVATFQDDFAVHNNTKTSNIISVEEEEDDDETPRLTWYDTYKDAVKGGMEGAVSSMWPPPPAEAKEYNLQECTRLWPQDYDSGGFFLTLIRRNY